MEVDSPDFVTCRLDSSAGAEKPLESLAAWDVLEQGPRDYGPARTGVLDCLDDDAQSWRNANPCLDPRAVSSSNCVALVAATFQLDHVR